MEEKEHMEKEGRVGRIERRREEGSRRKEGSYGMGGAPGTVFRRRRKSRC
jgi:hypothetical protein